jgi:hypothetical protein
MGLRNFFGYGFGGSFFFGGRRKGMQSSKNRTNLELSPAQKESVYKNRFNVFSHLQRVRSPDPSAEAVPVTDLEGFSAAGAFGGMIDVYNNYVYSVEASKEQRLALYREMAKYPEISFAVDQFVLEAVNPDEEGKFMDLIIKSGSIKSNDNIRKTITSEWNRLVYDIIQADEYVMQWFREYMIDGEIGFEKVIDNENPADGIKRIKKLRTSKLHPLWDDLEVDQISSFAYKTESNILALTTDMVAYANSGFYEYNQTEDDKVVLSFLEPAKTTYKRLKQLEDSLVIYRLVRAPERRIFNIEVGNLPKGRAEQYMKELIIKYRQKKLFDPRTGEAADTLDVMAMTEDYWFPVFNGGKKSSIETLPGGENLGQMDDVVYFRDKMYKGLKVPIKRFEADTGFSIGDTSDITREEVNFVKQVTSYSKRFANIFKQIFITHLQLRGITQEFGITQEDIAVHMHNNNLFDKFFQAKITEINFQRFQGYSNLINIEKPMLSREWVAKKILEISDTEWDNNQELLVAEEAALGDGTEEDDGTETPAS